MGAIGGLLGTAGGVSGTGIKGPNGANIINPVTGEQQTSAYNGAQNGLQSQQDLLTALQGQGGIATQSDVYNQSQNLANSLANANGVGAQSSALQAQSRLAGQQQGLANQYQNIANGTGPNPAQAMLNNATGQNVANQAALMAGQRGAGANVGLLARQAAQQGAATQQSAVGQGAQMQANQQLNALQGLSAAQQAIGGTNQSIAGIGGNLTSQLQGQQQGLTGQANTMVGQQMGATTGLSQGQQSEQGQLLGAQGNYNSAAVGSQGSVNAANASNANTKMAGQNDLVGGLMGPVGVAAKLVLAGGGPVSRAPMLAGGGMPPAIGAPTSGFGQFLSGFGGSSPQVMPAIGSEIQSTGTSNGAITKGMKGLADLFKKPEAPAPVDTGTATGFAQLPAEGPTLDGAPTEAPMGLMQPLGPAPAPMAQGGIAESGGAIEAKNPDQKAVVSGDSYANDKIPIVASEGEMMLPKSVMESQDPAAAAAEFVRNHLAKKGGGKMMADGGPTAAGDPGPMGLMPPEGPQEPPAAPAPVASTPEQQDAAESAQTAEPDSAPLTPAQQEDAEFKKPGMPLRAPTGFGVTPEEKLQQQMNFSNDLASGAISPKTYKDLYGKENTLGKVGTLLGLLVSGGGAGLTHQPNMIMGMMDKEIERDFDAQKQNVANGHNFLSLNYAHNLQQAQIAQHQMETLRSQNQGAAEAAGIQQNLIDQKVPGAAELVPNFFKRAAQIWAPIDAKTQTYQTTLHDLDMKTQGNSQANAMVKGPIAQQVGQRVAQLHQQGKKQTDALAQEGAAIKDVVNNGVLTAAIQRGQRAYTGPGSAVPSGAVSKDDAPLIKKEASSLAGSRSNYNAVADAFDTLSNMKNAGQVPGLKAAATGIGGAIGAITSIMTGSTAGLGAAETGVGAGAGNVVGDLLTDKFESDRKGRISTLAERLGIPEAKLDGWLPKWTDDDKTKATKMHNIAGYFAKKERDDFPTLYNYKPQLPTLFPDFQERKYVAPKPVKKTPGSSGDW